MPDDKIKVKVTGLTKRFRSGKKNLITAIENIDLDVNRGEFLVIVGPSGCGKTTLLRIIAGLEIQSSGKVEIKREQPQAPLNSMVFQEQSVLPWMTVRKNIEYGLAMRKIPREVREERVNHYLMVTSLSKFADAYPYQLSGGMKQRVSVARAFANEPEILLMDEPFAALDEQNKILLQQELLRIWEGSNKTVIYITHSIDEALILGDKVMVMTAHPGRIKSVMPIDLPRPRVIMELRKNPRFQDLFQEVWGQLREEVQKAKEREGLSVPV